MEKPPARNDDGLHSIPPVIPDPQNPGSTPSSSKKHGWVRKKIKSAQVSTLPPKVATPTSEDRARITRPRPMAKEALKKLEEMIADSPYVIRLFVEWHWNHDRMLINNIDSRNKYTEKTPKFKTPHKIKVERLVELMRITFSHNLKPSNITEHPKKRPEDSTTRNTKQQVSDSVSNGHDDIQDGPEYEAIADGSDDGFCSDESDDKDGGVRVTMERDGLASNTRTQPLNKSHGQRRIDDGQPSTSTTNILHAPKGQSARPYGALSGARSQSTSRVNSLRTLRDEFDNDDDDPDSMFSSPRKLGGGGKRPLTDDNQGNSAKRQKIQDAYREIDLHTEKTAKRLKQSLIVIQEESKSLVNSVGESLKFSYGVAEESMNTLAEMKEEMKKMEERIKKEMMRMEERIMRKVQAMFQGEE